MCDPFIKDVFEKPIQDIPMKLPDPNKNYDEYAYIEHPFIPPMKRNFKKENSKSWVWISAVIGDPDEPYDGEPIDVSNCSIPGLFKHKVPLSEIHPLTKLQYQKHIDKISKERALRLKLKCLEYNRERHKSNKTKNENLIILA